MSALEVAVTLIKREEGCILHPYRDPAGIPTIGWGATVRHGRAVTMQTAPITQAEADSDLAADVAGRLAAVQAALRRAPTDGQLGAMTSFAYNVGVGAFLGSALLRRFNAGDLAGAADEFRRWTRSKGRVLPGLVRRREAERAAFLAGVPGTAGDPAGCHAGACG